jgi:hypothetical protein
VPFRGRPTERHGGRSLPNRRAGTLRSAYRKDEGRASLALSPAERGAGILAPFLKSLTSPRLCNNWSLVITSDPFLFGHALPKGAAVSSPWAIFPSPHSVHTLLRSGNESLFGRIPCGKWRTGGGRRGPVFSGLFPATGTQDAYQRRPECPCTGAGTQKKRALPKCGEPTELDLPPPFD